MQENTLKIAIQKSGRLSEQSIALIKECGIQFNNAVGKLTASANNYPVEILFLRDDDIPGYVTDGVADIGIVGENVLLEKQASVKTILQLGFGKCRLSLAVPKAIEYKSLKDLSKHKIATSYPNILSDFLKSNNIEATIHEISGSVEIAPSIGLADAICDLVSSGSTLLSNGLKEVETVLKSQAVLVANNNLSAEKEKQLDDLLFRIKAVQAAKNNKYILLNAPNTAIAEITDILPGIKSPTVVPLADSGWSSIHSVVNENEFWQIIDKLKSAGAQGILVVPIEKMIV
jgi:ATP phosphoribosyltransferase